MRFKVEHDYRGLLLRSWKQHRGHSCEWAYARLGIKGLGLEIEFPSDWHQESRWWVHFGFGIGEIAFSGRWFGKLVADEYQCSGPRYGFKFFGDMLTFYWGKGTGRATDPQKSFYMPWSWRHKEHKILSEPETHPYRYVLRSGEVQERTAIICRESRLWLRPWLPWRLYRESIDIQFSDEVGEQTGSWKGGTTGCGWDIKPGESNLDALRRMERERKFS